MNLPRRFFSACAAGFTAVKRSWQDAWKGAELGSGSGARMTDAYSQSSWVYAGINIIAREISGVSLVHERGAKEYVSPELDAFWKRPAKYFAYSELITATIGWLSLQGRAFWVMDDTWLLRHRSNAKRSPLMLVPPDRMVAVKDSDGELLGWSFTDDAGRRWNVLPEQVILMKHWDPQDPLGGIGPLTPAQEAVEADWLARRYYLNLMRNSGDQGVYVIGKEGMPSQEQRDTIIAALRQKRELSLRGQFRPTFLSGNVEIKEPTVQAPDANFMATRLGNRHEIFIALGVPPSMADVVASYSIGSASDRYRLIEGTCIPLAEKLAEGMSRVSSILAQDSAVETRPDWDNHPVIAAVRAERISSATTLWDRGMSWRDINAFLDLGMKPFKGWDTAYLPFTVAPAGALDLTDDSDYAEDPDPDTDPAEDDATLADTAKAGLTGLAQLKTLLTVAPAVEKEEGCVCGCGGGDQFAPDDEWQKNRSAKEVAQWKDQMGKQRASRMSMASAVRRELLKARAETLQALEAKGPLLLALRTKAAAADFLFDLSKFSGSLLATLRQHSRRSLLSAGEQLAKELGKDDPYTLADPDAQAYLSARENRLKDVPADVWAKVRDNLQAGIDAGETMAQLTSRVKASFNELSRGRAERIAQTETSAAYAAGRQEAMTRYGVKYKRWVTSGNANVRASHRAANGQTVAVDEPFNVGGELLMHPGDSAGSPGNVINCHCVAVAIENPEDE